MFKNLFTSPEINKSQNDWQTIENVPIGRVLNLACSNGVMFYGWTSGERDEYDFSLIFYDGSTNARTTRAPSFWKFEDPLPDIKFDVCKYYESQRPVPRPPLVWISDTPDLEVCAEGDYKGYKIYKPQGIKEHFIITDEGNTVKTFFRSREDDLQWFED